MRTNLTCCTVRFIFQQTPRNCQWVRGGRQLRLLGPSQRSQSLLHRQLRGNFLVLTTASHQLLLFVFQLLHCFIFLSSLCGLTVLCSLTFTPPPKLNNNPKTHHSIVRTMRNNWSNFQFVVWAVMLPSALFGYFVPFVHLVEYAENLPLEETKASSLLAVLALASGAGRLIFGKLSDLALFNRNGNRIYLQQVRSQDVDTNAMLPMLPIC